MSFETRHMTRVYSTEAKIVNVGPDSIAKVQFAVWGATPNGRDIKFKIDANFSQWPCLFRSFSQAWEEERKRRESEIARIAATVGNVP